MHRRALEGDGRPKRPADGRGPLDVGGRGLVPLCPFWSGGGREYRNVEALGVKDGALKAAVRHL